MSNSQSNAHQILESMESNHGDSQLSDVSYISPRHSPVPLSTEKRKWQDLPEHPCGVSQTQRSEEYMNFLQKKHQDRMELLKQKLERRERHRQKKIKIQERQVEMMSALLEFLKR
ncbi:hypothetical protein K7432_012518 [Basidiobolus ranarum]|uniref:Uncharacterized protein n=1 Tax=Basidiobolus ranarum TaxID=34480 RepID=A0ABR2WKQ6_9FUNG